MQKSILTFLLLAVGTTSQSVICKDKLAGSFLASRLWQSAPGNCDLGPEEVVKTFKTGFAPEVTRLDDFQQYVGSVQTSATDRFERSYFYNIFSSEMGADVANILARDFVQTSKLDGKIINPGEPPNEGQFVGEIDFWSATECSPTSTGNTGRYLATRYWSSTEVSGQDIVNLFRDGFRDQITMEDGFQLYTGVVVSDKAAFFMNVFDTEAQAASANLLAAEFIEGSDLKDRITLQLASANLIKFDYLLEEAAPKYSYAPNGYAPNGYAANGYVANTVPVQYGYAAATPRYAAPRAYRGSQQQTVRRERSGRDRRRAYGY